MRRTASNTAAIYAMLIKSWRVAPRLLIHQWQVLYIPNAETVKKMNAERCMCIHCQPRYPGLLHM